MKNIRRPHGPRGYVGIGVYRPKTKENIGTLVRTAVQFSAHYVFTIGRRYQGEPSACRLDRHIPILHYDTYEDWQQHLPFGAHVVAIEMTPNAESLVHLQHPAQAVYLLGSEDHGLPSQLLEGVQVACIPGVGSLNVASVGAMVLYDRWSKTQHQGMKETR